jgi:hypothetical protein
VKTILRFVAINKLFFQRGWALIGNFGIVYLIASKLQEQLNSYYKISISIIILIPISIIATWALGWAEHQYGFFHAEQNFVYNAMRKKK